MLKKKQFIAKIQSLEGFDEPKIQLEQYSTDAVSTADLLYFIGLDNNDLINNIIIDLGAGTGRLCLGALLFGALGAVAIETEQGALAILQKNIKSLNFEERCLVLSENVKKYILNTADSLNPTPIDDLEQKIKDFSLRLTKTYQLTKNSNVQESSTIRKPKRICIMNPPFGVQKKGADKPFLELAMKISDKIYSIHHSNEKNRKYLTRFIESHGWQIKNIYSQKLMIEGTYFFHKKPQKYIMADIYQIIK